MLNILAPLLLTALLFNSTQLFARSSAVVYSQNYQIDQDLDLNAVASLFGDSRDLYDFEKRLNDPYYQISNLDFNNDGYVDYLRVIETVDRNVHFVVIQAVIGNRRYQDIATIEISKNYNQTYIQVVGNAYIYGPNYIIEPIYSYIPQIFGMFWQPRYYQAYRSSYRWRHYPSHYRPWRPVSVPHYHRHIRKHISHKNSYRHTKHRRARHSKKMHHKMRKNDYAKRYPKRSYKHRTSHRSVNRSTKPKNRTNNAVNRSTAQKRGTAHSTKRSNSREIKKHRTQQHRKDVKKSRKPTNRHINRQKIQQRSIHRERKQ